MTETYRTDVLPRTLEFRASVERIRTRGLDTPRATSGWPFPVAVTASLREEAGKGGVGPAILFGAEEDVSPALAARVSSAAIPVITIDQPISGAFYVGADNQGVGLALGHQVAIELSGTIRG